LASAVSVDVGSTTLMPRGSVAKRPAIPKQSFEEQMTSIDQNARDLALGERLKKLWERNESNDPVLIPDRPWGYWRRYPVGNEQLIEPPANRFRCVRCKIPPNGTRPEK
jgi:hypothetical protein